MHLKQPIVPKMPHVFERLAAELFGIAAGRCVVICWKGAEAGKHHCRDPPHHAAPAKKADPLFSRSC